MTTRAENHARRFAAIFPDLYLAFCKTTDEGPRLTPESLSVLQHLALSGPLTITESARHMRRAQSVMSEIVAGLVSKSLLARIPDARDRRRVLVWLTDAGHKALETSREVLSHERLARAFAALDDSTADALLAGSEALLRASHTGHAPPPPLRRDSPPKKKKERSP